MIKRNNIEEDRIDEFKTVVVGFVVKNRLVVAEALREFIERDRVVRKLAENVDNVRLVIMVLETMDDYTIASMAHVVLNDDGLMRDLQADELDFELINSLSKIGLKLSGQYNIADLQKIKYDKEMDPDDLERVLMERFPDHFFEEI
tara:strand:+ start:673 stop:1110 length:438 start_codon:yes stop_codon:yes gene_type:complete